MSVPSKLFHDKSCQAFDDLRNSDAWQIRDNVHIPALHRAVFVMLVKNAEDIIGINLRHHYSLGFRRFFILDNNSNDKTANIILSFKQEYTQAEVFYSTDFVVGYYQKSKTEAMARFAECYLQDEIKPSWIFPVDADEFITCCTKNTDKAVKEFSDYLTDPTIKILVFNWAQTALFSKEKNEITTFGNSLSETDFQVWKKMTACVTKSAYRTGCNISPTMGNHFVDGYQGSDEGLRSMSAIGFHMLHFPFRSIEQFRLKIMDGINALHNTHYHKTIGAHWRYYYQEYAKRGDDLLQKELWQHINNCL